MFELCLALRAQRRIVLAKEVAPMNVGFRCVCRKKPPRGDLPLERSESCTYLRIRANERRVSLCTNHVGAGGGTSAALAREGFDLFLIFSVNWL